MNTNRLITKKEIEELNALGVRFCYFEKTNNEVTKRGERLVNHAIRIRKGLIEDSKINDQRLTHSSIDWSKQDY